jgi:hypothetical protein
MPVELQVQEPPEHLLLVVRQGPLQLVGLRVLVQLGSRGRLTQQVELFLLRVALLWLGCNSYCKDSSRQQR